MTSTQQRAALQRQIWHIANEVRGAVDDSVCYAKLADVVITPAVRSDAKNHRHQDRSTSKRH